MFDLGGLCVVSTFSLELSGEVYFSRGLYSDQMSAMGGVGKKSNEDRIVMNEKKRNEEKNKPETIRKKETEELTVRYANDNIERFKQLDIIRQEREEKEKDTIERFKQAAIIREGKETEEKEAAIIREEAEGKETETEERALGGKRRKTRRSKRSRKTKKRKQKRSKKVLTSSAFQKIKNKK